MLYSRCMRKQVRFLLPLATWLAYGSLPILVRDVPTHLLLDALLLPLVVMAWHWGMFVSLLGSAVSLSALLIAAPELWAIVQPSGEVWDVSALLIPFAASATFAHFGGMRRKLVVNEKLASSAQYDDLTGLLNRAALLKQLEQAIQHAERTDSVLAVLFVDLDRFKHVNDSFGHEVGDALLINVATCLRDSIRKDDLVARLGGDEFVVVLRDLSEPKAAALVADKLVKRISAPWEIRGKLVHVSASIGISLYPTDGRDVATLTTCADSAMYKIKGSGKNHYTFSTQELQVQQSRRLQLERQLRWALEDNQFELNFQPQVNLSTRKVEAFEVLLRWENPELGNISPEEFIPLAEEAGLIVPIGHWLIREACHQAVTWQRAGYAPVRLAVNVSALQFNQPNFADLVVRALNDSGLDPQWLEIEITESLLMKELEQATRTLRKLQHIGVRTVLDDFGTGYSSLAYLQLLPIQTLKIDRSFVMTLNRTGAAQASNVVIIEAICAMAHKLKKTIVAEGVETEGQRDFLTRLGCDYGQGYLFSRPLLAEQVTRFLHTQREALERQPAVTRQPQLAGN